MFSIEESHVLFQTNSRARVYIRVENQVIYFFIYNIFINSKLTSMYNSSVDVESRLIVPINIIKSMWLSRIYDFTLAM